MPKVKAPHDPLHAKLMKEAKKRKKHEMKMSYTRKRWAELMRAMKDLDSDIEKKAEEAKMAVAWNWCYVQDAVDYYLKEHPDIAPTGCMKCDEVGKHIHLSGSYICPFCSHLAGIDQTYEQDCSRIGCSYCGLVFNDVGDLL